MANKVFPEGKKGFALGEIDWDTAVIKAALVRGYTYSDAHKFMSDVTGGGGGTVVGTPQTLTNKTATIVAGNVVLDADDVQYLSIAPGAAIEHVVVYQSSAVTGGADVAASAQRVIGAYDSGTGLPVTPDGNNINVAWDNGANKMFAL